MKIAVFMMFLVLISSAAALTGHIYYQQENKETQIVVTYYNNEHKKIRDLQSTVYIPDLDYYEKTGEFYLKGTDSGKSRLFMELDEGYYPVIVTLQNDDGVRERKHTWIVID